MIWKITAYNGTVWYDDSQRSLIDALEKFYKETSLSQLDIKKIENLH